MMSLFHPDPLIYDNVTEYDAFLGRTIDLINTEPFSSPRSLMVVVHVPCHLGQVRFV